MFYCVKCIVLPLTLSEYVVVFQVQQEVEGAREDDARPGFGPAHSACCRDATPSPQRTAVLGGRASHAARAHVRTSGRHGRPSQESAPSDAVEVELETTPPEAAQPVAAAAQPVATFAQPVAAAAQPVATSAQPVATSAQPVATSAQPVATSAQPVAAAAQPVATSAQPVAAAAQPVATSAQPVAAAAQPVATSAQPVATQPAYPVAISGLATDIRPGTPGVNFPDDLLC